MNDPSVAENIPEPQHSDDDDDFDCELEDTCSDEDTDWNWFFFSCHQKGNFEDKKYDPIFTHLKDHTKWRKWVLLRH